MRARDCELRLDFDANGPALIFGGPYSNLHAVDALFVEAERLGVPTEHMICTGDVVGYCGDPLRTVQRIRQSDVAVLMGNCEEQLGNGADGCGCGFSPEMTCHILSREWYSFAASELDEDSRAWMRALPRRIRLKFGNRELLIVHGGSGQINQFIFASTDWTEKESQIATAGVDGILAGHCGIPFTQIQRGRLWHNAGVIGMPANDGQPSTWYSLLHSDRESIRIEHRQLNYAHGAAAKRMRCVGLSQHYSAALKKGLWPSLDVLPPQEKVQTGEPLRLTNFFWREEAIASARSPELNLIAR
jgi:predicted phosphodiesterase